MKLKVLGSDSSGSCYILENYAEAVIIEAGLPFKEVKKALGFNIRKIKAVIISHEHGDHRKYWYEYARDGIPVFEPFRNEGQIIEFENSNFLIQAFPNRSKDGHWFHGNSNGAECPCYGFYVHHPDIGSLVYITDTECVRWRFGGVNHILVQANYSKDLVSDIPEKRKHVLTGHMEIGTTCEFLEKNRSPALRNVILLHLSGDSADAEDFKARAEKVVECQVYVARKGLEVDLNLCPF